MPGKHDDLDELRRSNLETFVAAWAQQIQVDRITVEAVRALRELGVRAVLLKGPVIAQWLYAEAPTTRGYIDADLLVRRDQYALAESCLLALGYEAESAFAVLEEDWSHDHSRPFRRSRDGANVDLHHSLHGTEWLDWHEVWNVIERHLEPIEVAGEAVDAPDVTLRALHVILHLSPEDGASAKPWRDLTRALDQVEFCDWAAAAELARELGIESELGVRLRRVPAGAPLADALGLPHSGSVRYLVDAMAQGGVAPTNVVGIYRFRAIMKRSPRDGLRYAARKLFPPAAQLQRDFPELAARGRLGLGYARIVRFWDVLGQVRSGLRGYRSAVHAATSPPRRSGN
jgi:hypothetical protein